MAIYFRDHFGMTHVVSPSFIEQEEEDRAWGNIEPRVDEGIEIPEGYQVLGQSERYLGFCRERVARIALGVLCVIASLGFALYFSESVQRCFTGRQVIVLVSPPIREEAREPVLGAIHQTRLEIERPINEAREQIAEGGVLIGLEEFQRGLIRQLIESLEEQREDPAVMAFVCAEFGRDALEAASPAMKDNFDVVFSAVTKDGGALEQASERLRDHRGIVTAACRGPRRGYVIQYASDALKGDEAFILSLVERNGLLLRYIINGGFREQEKFVRAAVQNNGLALQFASAFQADEAIVRLAAEQNSSALQFADPVLRRDEQFVRFAVKKWGYFLEFLPDQFRRNREIVMEALEQITTLPWEEKQCRPPVLGWVAQELLEDRELVLAAVTHCGHSLNVLKYYRSSLASDREIVEAAMNEWPWALQYASEDLQRDPVLQEQRNIIAAQKIAAIGGEAELNRLWRIFNPI